MNQRILVALVENKPGVLNRVASLFRRRGFNIASISVGPSERPAFSRMTLVVEDGAAVEQMRKQFQKIIEVVEVTDITDEDVVTRELALVRVKASSADRSEILQLVNIFRADIVDVAPESMIIEFTGDEDKLKAFLELLKPFGVQEVMRTGLVAIPRGAK